jgi:RNA polymerase-binding transcription factor
MARREALLRLHKSLMSRRDELRRRLGMELKDLGNLNPGDAADVAFGAGSEEVTSHLAELEARELRQVERAMSKIKTGTYGTCESCSAKIPVERLNALPYSTLCVKCQREMETSSGWGGGRLGANWDQVSDADAGEPSRVDLSNLEMDLSR